MQNIKRYTLLSIAIVAALASAGVQARELDNIDINALSRAPAKAAPKPGVELAAALKQTHDAIGREAFTWVQQDLPALDKSTPLDGEGAARAHLARLLGATKSTDDLARALKLRKVDVQLGESKLVQFEARINGISIFHEDLAMLLDRKHRLVAMRGPLPRTAPSAAKSLPGFKLGAAQAIAVAMGAYDFDTGVDKRLKKSGEKGEYQHFVLDARTKSASGAMAQGEQRAKQVYFRTAKGLQPAWYVETQIADSADAAYDAYAHVISAVDGSLLFRLNQTADATDFTYKVWAEDGTDRLPWSSPQGRVNIPDPDGLPGTTPAPGLPQSMRTLANAPFSRSASDGWLPNGATTTSGNNVNAYADLAAPSGFGDGDVQPIVTSPGTFDYTFSHINPPNLNVTQSSAATVQLFYYINWLHDWFYDVGFAESDGNAQLDNFGRGGLGGDRIFAEAQDYNVNNNANMTTPGDGRPPRMQMGLWGSGTIMIDSSIDGSTIAHEWGHYLSNRLVGNATGLSTEHARGMGEGWSDFLALLSMVKAEDKLRPANANFGGAYADSSYLTGDSYFGIRRYPYSTNTSKNPLTFGHVSDSAGLPSQIPTRFTAAENSATHRQGEFWANVLWECYVALLNDTSRLSFSQAQQRMKTYLVGGLKLTPNAPTMPEARDALLATILASGETRDFELFVAAFAKRGLGAGAFVPDRYSESMGGVVESFAQGGDIAVVATKLGLPVGCDTDAVLDLGETAMVTVTVQNTGFVALNSATATLTASDPAIEFPAGATVAIGHVPLHGTATATVPVKLNASLAPNARVSITATPDAAGINSPPGIPGSLTTYVNFDDVPSVSTIEEFDGTVTNWEVTSNPQGFGAGTWSAAVAGDIRYLHGDDTRSQAVLWVESPVMATGAGNLSITLNHRFTFEIDAEENYDAGLIQVSTDGGTTWSDIDPVAAGYSAGVISSCCSNPLAGKKGYFGATRAFPLFVDDVINLGTTYANQSNFRIRFGIATDGSVDQGGWDINSVNISGLTNTPFSRVSAQAPVCSIANNKSLQGAMSGTYYSAARDGEGVLVDFGELGGTPVLFFTWYTYEGGEQQWLVGSNTFSSTDNVVAVDLINTRGANFGSAFSSGDVSELPWGSVAMTFPDCDTLALTYQKDGGEVGTLTLGRGLERLERAQCNVLHGGLSGTYYSAERSGEGVLVDFGKVGGTPVEFFTWYTYEGGEQRWLVGSTTFAPNDSSANVELINTRGAKFGRAFRPQDVQVTPWGTVTQRFINCDTLELSYQKTGGESGTQILTRGLGRLGDGQCR